MNTEPTIFQSGEPGSADPDASRQRLADAIEAQQRSEETAGLVNSLDNESQISIIIQKLSELKFSTSLTDEEKALGKKAMMITRKTPKVHRLGSKWTVKFYLGRKQRCFGFYDDYLHCMRVADLLTYRYFHRRSRKMLRQPHDYDFNLGLARAKADADNESDFISLLCSIDALLPEKKPRASRKNVRLNTVGSKVDKLRVEVLELIRQSQQNAVELQEIKKVLTTTPPVLPSL